MLAMNKSSEKGDEMHVINLYKSLISCLRPEYRIVRDNYSGYEVQWKGWYFPFWREVGCNTHVTVEGAERYALNHSNETIKYLGRL